MKFNSTARYTLILCLVLIVLVGAGRYFFKPKPRSQLSQPVKPVEQPAQPKPQPVVEDPIVSCAKRLAAQTEKDSYVPGSVLIRFAGSVSYNQAQAFLQKANLTSNTTESVYAGSRIMTVSTKPGNEFAVICEFKQMPLVKGATLNYVFEIHQ